MTGNALSCLFTQGSCVFSSVIVLATWNQMRQFIAVVIKQTEQKTHAVVVHGLVKLRAMTSRLLNLGMYT